MPPVRPIGPAVSSYEETRLPDGRIELHAWGRIGDPIPRPGLETKYPSPESVGLTGYDRWHLAGPNAVGAEEGIAYAPHNFNVSKTATAENVVRRMREAIREQGGEGYFDFRAKCRVQGEHEGVEIRIVEEATWTVDVRPAGSDKIVNVLHETAAVPATPVAAPPPSPPLTSASPLRKPAASKPGSAGRKPTTSAPAPAEPVSLTPEPVAPAPPSVTPAREPVMPAPKPITPAARPSAPALEPKSPAGLKPVAAGLAANAALLAFQLVIGHLQSKLAEIERVNVQRGLRLVVQPEVETAIKFLYELWHAKPETRPNGQRYVVVMYGLTFEKQPHSEWVPGGPVYLYKETTYLGWWLSTAPLEQRLIPPPPQFPGLELQLDFPTYQVFETSVPVAP